MELLQKVFNGQNVEIAESICPLASVNPYHPVHVNAIILRQGTHGAFPRAVPFFGKLYLDADNMWWGCKPTFSCFNHEINFDAARRPIEKKLAIPFLGVIENF